MCFVLAFVRMWLINIRFHISQSKERGGDKLSLSAIIKSNLYLSGPANGLNYLVLTSELLFYGLGKLALTVYSLFAKGIFNKENPLFICGSVSRLMFCCHSMIYTVFNLNNNLCWDSTSYRWNESEVSSSKSSLERSH